MKLNALKVLFASLVGFCFLAAAPLSARADEEIRFIVGYSPGGSFDAYTRLIARHFGKHMPGNPRTIVQNMTGAGGLIAANYLYNKAKPDGRTIGAFASPLILQHVMKNKAAKFDGRKFGYLGVPSGYDTICTFTEASGIKSVDDWMKAERPQKIGAIGPGTSTSDVPKLLREATTLPIKVIDGYGGGSRIRIALERNEIDAYCGSWQALKGVARSQLDRTPIVLQASLQPHPEIKDVPLAINYAKSPEVKPLLELADTGYRGQFVYMVPPGTPRERLESLQKAFVDTLNDPELQEEAKKSRLEIEPIDGPTTAAKMSSLYDLSPETVSTIKDILVPKK